MSGQDDLERLRALESRIIRMRQEHEPAPKKTDSHALGQVAWRMVTELVAGLLVGFGIGLGLDVLFDTRPIFLVLFTLLGLAAGIRTMMRSAADLQRQSEQQAGKPAGDRGETGRG